jgi:membrane-associated phospholipid phosphatase
MANARKNTTTRSLLSLRLLVIAVSAIVVAHLLDGWMYRNFRVDDIYGTDWGRMLRVVGFVPLWFVAAVALWLHELPARTRRPLLLALSPALAGLAGEVFKLLLRRERPGAHDGLYFFRPFDERTFSTSGLALPSSHAIVAFGGAAVLSKLFPRAWPVWWGLAWGCALSRVAAGAHFLSDVVLSAILGWSVAAALERALRPRQSAGEAVTRAAESAALSS